MQEGDNVSIIYCDGNYIEDATILHMPTDTGDMWFFKDNKNGNEIAQNPQSSNFDTVIKAEKK